MTPKRVQQEESYGCGIACAASLMGCSYQEARARFAVLHPTRLPCLSDRGITDCEVDALLAAHGYAVARRWRSVDEKRGAPWPPPPWAPAHLVQAILPAGAHFVVMLADGTVLDPATPARRRLSDFGEIISVSAVVPVLERIAA